MAVLVAWGGASRSESATSSSGAPTDTVALVTTTLVPNGSAGSSEATSADTFPPSTGIYASTGPVPSDVAAAGARPSWPTAPTGVPVPGGEVGGEGVVVRGGTVAPCRGTGWDGPVTYARPSSSTRTTSLRWALCPPVPWRGGLVAEVDAAVVVVYGVANRVDPGGVESRDLLTGALRWRREVPAQSSAEVVGDEIRVTTRGVEASASITALDARTGAVRSSGVAPESSPFSDVTVGDLVVSIVPTNDVRRISAGVQATDRVSGRVLWTYGGNDAWPVDGADGVVLVQMPGETIALDAHSGLEQWRVAGDAQPIASTDTRTRPAYIRSGVIVLMILGADGGLQGRRLGDGTLLWRLDWATTSAFPVQVQGDAGDVLFLQVPGGMEARNLFTGVPLWRSPTPISHADHTSVVTYDRRLLDAATGREVGRLVVPCAPDPNCTLNEALVASVAFPDDAIILSVDDFDGDRTIVCASGTQPKLAAVSQWRARVRVHRGTRTSMRQSPCLPLAVQVRPLARSPVVAEQVRGGSRTNLRRRPTSAGTV